MGYCECHAFVLINISYRVHFNVRVAGPHHTTLIRYLCVAIHRPPPVAY